MPYANFKGPMPQSIQRKANAIISIVAPFFNEGPSVELFYDAISAVAAQLPHCTFEFICVDDGSSDDTLSKLLAVHERDARCIIIELSRNFGKEAALTAGIDFANGDVVIPIDTDLQDPPTLIPLLVNEWLNGADVVVARRTDRSTDSFLKRKTAQIFYRVNNAMSTVQIPENVGDFRLMDRMAIDALKKLPERQRFMKGLFAWVGFRTATVDYARPPRVAGQTKFSGWKLWNFALEGITSFSTTPLRIWTYIGLIAALSALVYAAYVVVRTLVYGIDVPGYASVLVLILLFGSLQLISVGLLGEYIGRIYIESKQRPNYLVRSIHRKS